MRIETSFPLGGGALKVNSGLVALLAVALAVGTSTIVFSEPAVADVFMLAVIIGLPILGVIRIGLLTKLNFLLWLVVTAFGLLAAGFSPEVDTAIKYQLITMFLVFGAVVIAGYVTADPVRRFEAIMWCYVAACFLATIAELLGYFGIVPSLYDIATLFGRVRGTFKDPNVYGAALVPAMVFLGWNLLRDSGPRARLSALLAIPLGVGLLLSYSRGAWFAVIVGLAVLFFIAGARSRRRQDFSRYFMVVAAAFGVAIVAVLVLLQIEQVRELMFERFALQQSYDQGPDGRFAGQIKSFWLMVENPFGIGTHTFGEVYHHEQPHNVYLSTFLNAGWLAGLFYMSSVLLTLLIGLRRSLRNGWLQGPLIVMVAAFAALVAEGMVIDTDHWRHFFLVMGCLWGLIDAAEPTGPDRRHEDLV